LSRKKRELRVLNIERCRKKQENIMLKMLKDREKVQENGTLDISK
jgi:hypothetical protein